MTKARGRAPGFLKDSIWIAPNFEDPLPQEILDAFEGKGDNMPKVDIASVTERKGSTYPAPFNEVATSRIKKALGDAAGLTQFGVNLTRLPPGEWSSQRHWHSEEDEFVYVLSGTLTLVTNAGRSTLGAGECAGFPKGTGDAHHLINEGTDVAVYLEVGTRLSADVTTYPDIDLHAPAGNVGYTHKDGRAYPKS